MYCIRLPCRTIIQKFHAALRRSSGKLSIDTRVVHLILLKDNHSIFLLPIALSSNNPSSLPMETDSVRCYSSFFVTSLTILYEFQSWCPRREELFHRRSDTSHFWNTDCISAFRKDHPQKTDFTDNCQTCRSSTVCVQACTTSNSHCTTISCFL